jgi:hypothetical protein
VNGALKYEGEIVALGNKRALKIEKLHLG